MRTWVLSSLDTSPRSRRGNLNLNPHGTILWRKFSASATRQLATILGTEIVLGIVELLFPGFANIVVLSVALGGVALLAGVARLVRGTSISGYSLLTLTLIVSGIGLLAYGMWSTTTLYGTPGGFGSYAWVIAQVNVLAGMFSAGMGVVFFSLPRKRI